MMVVVMMTMTHGRIAMNFSRFQLWYATKLSEVSGVGNTMRLPILKNVHVTVRGRTPRFFMMATTGRANQIAGLGTFKVRTCLTTYKLFYWHKMYSNPKPWSYTTRSQCIKTQKLVRKFQLDVYPELRLQLVTLELGSIELLTLTCCTWRPFSLYLCMVASKLDIPPQNHH